MSTPHSPEGFSPLRAARLLLAAAMMAFVFALPESLRLAQELLHLI